MDEKYIFGLEGTILGAILTIAKELYAEKRSRIKEAEYLAIRMVCIFESFMEEYATVVGDDGLYHGQTDSEVIRDLIVDNMHGH